MLGGSLASEQNGTENNFNNNFRMNTVKRSIHRTAWGLVHTTSAIMRMAGMLRIKDKSTMVVKLAAIPEKPLPPCWEPWACGALVSVVTLDGKSAMMGVLRKDAATANSLRMKSWSQNKCLRWKCSSSNSFHSFKMPEYLGLVTINYIHWGQGHDSIFKLKFSYVRKTNNQ